MNWTIAQIASVVLCAMGSGVILSSLGHSPIIGYIIAGVLLGPSCLQFITDRTVVAVFSEMGILFLLFTIGLSLSFEKVKNMWKKSIMVTAFSTLFTYFFMFAIGCFLKIPQTGIVLMTFCVALSSTAVTVKSLKHLKEHDASIEASTFGILIAQDVFAIIMVLIINFLGGNSHSAGDAYKIIAIFIFLTLLGFALLKLNHYVHKLTNFIKKHSDMLTMFVFGICLGSAVIAEIFGLSAAFGAFVAGLILGNSSMKNEIKNITLPIEEILLMTFFLSIGLLVDIEFILSNFSIILFGLLFVTFGKTIINVFVLRLCKFPLKESFVISVLLGHIGEFAFMLSYSASKVGLINEFGLKFLVSLTALSLFLSPFWLAFAGRCKVLAEKIHIKSSWEFSRVALDREITKLHHLVVFISKFCRGIISVLKEKTQEVIEKAKNKVGK